MIRKAIYVVLIAFTAFVVYVLLLVFDPFGSNETKTNEIKTNQAETREDECLYNQEAFKEMHIELGKEFKDSRFLEKDQAVEITMGNAKAVVRYFGCEHYATEIKYFENNKDAYSEKKIFDKSVSLVEQFGQKRVEPSELDKMLQAGKYKKTEENVYLINYPTMDEFSISVNRSAGKPLIEISFYN